MEEVKINLRQENRVVFLVDHDVVYSPSFDDIPQLDSGYTLMLDEGLGTEVSFTVGSGLTLGTDSIIWNLDTGNLDSGHVYSGYLKSDSNVAGVYLYIEIELDVK